MLPFSKQFLSTMTIEKKSFLVSAHAFVRSVRSCRKLEPIYLALWIVLISLCCMGYSGFANAQPIDPHQPEACAQTVSVGAIFYNFRKLYVVYNNFPQEDRQQERDYPPSLKYEDFNERLLKSLKSNFGDCLKNADGSEKKIIVSKPRAPFPVEAHDPKNLTLFISMFTEDFKSNGMLTLFKPTRERFMYVFFFFYRPEVQFKNGRLPMGNNSVETILQLNGDDKMISKKIDEFFDRLRPMRAPPLDFIPPGENSIFYH